jgi:hypothetical protein
VAEGEALSSEAFRGAKFPRCRTLTALCCDNEGELLSRTTRFPEGPRCMATHQKDCSTCDACAMARRGCRRSSREKTRDRSSGSLLHARARNIRDRTSLDSKYELSNSTAQGLRVIHGTRQRISISSAFGVARQPYLQHSHCSELLLFRRSGATRRCRMRQDSVRRF